MTAVLICICPQRWQGIHRIPCDHDLERAQLWQDRYDEWWNE